MSARNRVEVMHGVNLDQLGRRPAAVYGELTYDRCSSRSRATRASSASQVRFFQTNAEREFVEHLHRLDGLSDAIVMNPGAWTHYAWAIRDALEIAGAARPSRCTCPTWAAARSGGACRSCATCAWRP